MGVIRRKKARGPYDKIVRQAQELIRQELAPLKAGQQAIAAQNDKILEYVRQIWSNVAGRPDDESEE
jgi:hypothetical protein